MDKMRQSMRRIFKYAITISLGMGFLFALLISIENFDIIVFERNAVQIIRGKLREKIEINTFANRVSKRQLVDSFKDIVESIKNGGYSIAIYEDVDEEGYVSCVVEGNRDNSHVSIKLYNGNDSMGIWCEPSVWVVRKGVKRTKKYSVEESLELFNFH